jgi:hypothetical protein
MGRRRPAIARLVERTIRAVRVVALPAGIRADPVRAAVVANLAELPSVPRMTCGPVAVRRTCRSRNRSEASAAVGDVSGYVGNAGHILSSLEVTTS